MRVRVGCITQSALTFISFAINADGTGRRHAPPSEARRFYAKQSPQINEPACSESAPVFRFSNSVKAQAELVVKKVEVGLAA